ncbi:endothelin-converting enzyme 1-like [Dermacentor variabilis]|uniref:endothelin-converting enzyme 1-like n=1 Tax=Dermacentor variabilis TaxID=34621 RepID=UPI003F5C7C92
MSPPGSREPFHYRRRPTRPRKPRWRPRSANTEDKTGQEGWGSHGQQARSPIAQVHSGNATSQTPTPTRSEISGGRGHFYSGPGGGQDERIASEQVVMSPSRLESRMASRRRMMSRHHAGSRKGHGRHQEMNAVDAYFGAFEDAFGEPSPAEIGVLAPIDLESGAGAVTAALSVRANIGNITLKGGAGGANGRAPRKPAIKRGPISVECSAPASTPVNVQASRLRSVPRRTVEMALALGVFFAVTLLVVVLVAQAWIPHAPHTDPFCHSDECLSHARLMESKLDVAVDPCEDFNAYACARWEPPSEYYSYATTVANLAVDNWFMNFRSIVAKGIEDLPAGLKLQAMFNVCVASVLDESSKRMLTDFMKERKIPWPDDPIPEANPLGVILDLAYNWAVDLWFDVQPLHRPKGTTGLSIASGNLVNLWGSYFRDAVPRDRYVEYWNSFYVAFVSPDDPGERAASEITRIADIESDIVAKLSNAFERRGKVPARFKVADIEKHADSFSSGEWTTVLEANVRLYEGMLKPSDYVTFSDIALLQATNEFFSKYSRTDLLRHLSWFFIQIFAPFGGVGSSLADSGDDSRAVMRRLVFCVTQAEAAYRVLVASLYVQPRFAAEERLAVEAHFDRVRQVTMEKIANLSWGDNLSKYMCTVKLQELKTLLWPPVELLAANGLSDLYANFASNKSTPFDFWHDAHENLRALREKPHYEMPLTKLPVGSVPPLVRYDYLRNTVGVSAAALSPPLYASRSTPAMMYGGLMFSYARELVRVLDSTGLKIDPQGDVVPSWASSSWQEGASRASSCLAPGFSSPFPEIPTLEVAYAAFERALSSAASGGSPWRTTDALSEQRVFFITACFTLCSQNRTAAFLRGDCNKAFAHFPKFAEAFACVPGSAMNPPKKCTFFN